MPAGAPFPERTGELAAIAEGSEGARTWELWAQDSTAGACVELRDDAGEETVGCGFEVPERHQVGFLAHPRDGDGGFALLAGPVSKAADAVRLEFATGEALTVEPVGQRAGFPTNFYLAPITGREPLAAVVALGAGGEELERRPARPEASGDDHAEP